jgi:DNA-binding NarL/FixJ family response regulator
MGHKGKYLDESYFRAEEEKHLTGYRKTIQHLDIVESYFQGLSMGKIAKKLDRSAAMVHAQVHSHNESTTALSVDV